MPLFYLSIAFILGVLVSPLLSLATQTALVLAGVGIGVASGLFAFWLWKPENGRIERVIWVYSHAPPALALSPEAVPPPVLLTLPILAVVCSLLGIARFQANQPDLTSGSHLARFNDTEEVYTVVGVLVSPPDLRENITNLHVSRRVYST